MWIEKISENKFKYIERYIDPYTEKYKKVSITLTSDSAQASKKANKILNSKIDDKLNNKNYEKMTFDTLCQKWWKKYPQTVKATTALRTSTNLNIIKNKIPQDYQINNIDSIHLQNIIDELYYDACYSLSTTKQLKYVLNTIFSFAEKNEFIAANPAKKIEIKPKPIKYEDVKKIQDKYLELSELTALINQIRESPSNKRHADLAEFMALTGVRFGEAIALKEENNFTDYFEIDGTIDYNSTKVSEANKTTPKNQSAHRRVKHTQRTNELLDELIVENKYLNLSEKYDDREFIFTSLRGHPMGLSNFNRIIQKNAKQCAITKYVSSHIFRHTHISLLSELGIELKAIMQRVGHSKPEVTLEIYSHVTKNMEHNMIDKLNSIKI